MIRIRLIDRYVTREFLLSQLTALAILVIVVTVVDVWERVDTYLDQQATWGEVARFHLYSLPFTLMISVPVSLLLGAVFSLGRLARRNELTALRTTGLSLPRVLAPILLFSLGASFFSLAFNELVVPRANRARDRVYEVDIHGAAPPQPGKKSNVSFLGRGGQMYQIGEFDAQQGLMKRVMILEFRKNRLARRLDAEEARWDGSRWVFYRGFTRVFGAEGQEVASPFDTLTVEGLQEKPGDFAEGVTDPELMSYGDLRRHVARLRASGSETRRYEVEQATRFAMPFADFIVVLLGAPLAAASGRGGVARGIGLGLALAFLYYGLLRLSQALGNNAALPAHVAPWTANSVFALAGVFLLRHQGKS